MSNVGMFETLAHLQSEKIMLHTHTKSVAFHRPYDSIIVKDSNKINMGEMINVKNQAFFELFLG